MFRSRKFSGEALSNLKKAKVGATLSPLAKANRLLIISHVITIKDIDTDKTKCCGQKITCKSFNITKLYGQR
jgi:hypothetical protein